MDLAKNHGGTVLHSLRGSAGQGSKDKEKGEKINGSVPQTSIIMKRM